MKSNNILCALCYLLTDTNFHLEALTAIYARNLLDHIHIVLHNAILSRNKLNKQ